LDVAEIVGLERVGGDHKAMTVQNRTQQFKIIIHSCYNSHPLAETWSMVNSIESAIVVTLQWDCQRINTYLK